MEENMESFLEEAKELYSSNKCEEAVEILNQILDMDPENVDGFYWRGECRRVLEEYKSALIDLKQSDKLKQNDARTVSAMGMTEIQLGELDSAIKHLKHSLRIRPRNIFTLQQLGNAYLLKGNLEDALNILNEAHKLDSKDWYTIWKRGVVYRKLGQLDQSTKDLKLAIQINPDRSDLHIDLADTFREMKLFAQAMDQLSNIDSTREPIIRAHICIDKGDLTAADLCLKNVEPKLRLWREFHEFQEVKKLFLDALKKRPDSNSKSEIKKERKQEPITADSLVILQKLNQENFERMNQALIESFKAQNSELLISELRNNVIELKQKSEKLERKNKDLEFEIKETQKINKDHERRLQCMICMDNPRDTIVMPCLHFLFCDSCMHEHRKTSKQCPSCRQSMTGSLNCLLEGEEPIRKLKKEETKL